MTETHPLRTYGATWAALLVLTLVLLSLESAALPRGVFVSLMVVAMLAKASIIGAYFMHLRFERVSLVAMVVVGLLVTGAVLYFLIVPDARRIHEMSGQTMSARP
jgi:cytochrome c oxidase subunit IV